MTLAHARRGQLRLAIAMFTCLATAMACSGGSSGPTVPGSSSGSSGGSGTCRTYATPVDVTTTALGVTVTAKATASFSTSTNQTTIQNVFSSGPACTTVNTYRSTADFVDEVRVIPGVFLLLTAATTNTAACGGGGTFTATFVYDAQRRLTQTTSIGGTTTWTAWDSSGRPTNGSSPGFTYVNVYDDAGRK